MNEIVHYPLGGLSRRSAIRLRYIREKGDVTFQHLIDG